MRGVRILTIVAVAAALAGCASHDESAPFITHPDSGAGMDALVAGTLALHEGCLFLVTDAGDYVPTLPRSTDWVPPASLRLGSAVYSIGERVEWGGGELGTVAQLRADGQYSVPEACPDDPLVWRVG